MKNLRLLLPATLAVLVLSSLYSMSDAASGTTGLVGNQVVVPWDVEPWMTGSVSPGYTEVTEGHTVIATVTGIDTDKYNKISDGSFVYLTGDVSWGSGTIASGTGTSPVGTVTSSNTNSGTYVWTVTHTARTIPAGEPSHLYVDSYSVVDTALPSSLVKDAGVTALAQQVLINKQP